jgi:hypothetical protein
VRLVPFLEDRITNREVNRMVENVMVVDSHWREREQEPKVIAECAGCENEIYSGQDVYEFTPDTGHKSVLIHQNLNCCREYISNLSRCLTAGEQ